MATVGESIALDTLLSWLCGHSKHGIAIPSTQEARMAAELLAGKQSKTGACSFSVEDVKAFWPKHRPDDTLRCASCGKSVEFVRLISSHLVADSAAGNGSASATNALPSAPIVDPPNRQEKKLELSTEHYRRAEIAYNAYCKQTGGKSLATGDTLPPFTALRPAIKDAWAASAIALANDAEMQARKNNPKTEGEGAE